MAQGILAFTFNAPVEPDLFVAEHAVDAVERRGQPDGERTFGAFFHLFDGPVVQRCRRVGLADHAAVSLVVVLVGHAVRHLQPDHFLVVRREWQADVL